MNLKEMFQLQKILDERIRKEHNLVEANLLEEKLLAFQVELGELANETRCFKYWSLKPPSEQTIILEEYVDGLHFLLSIGIDLHTVDIEKEVVDSQESLTKQFSLLIDVSGRVWRERKNEDFIELFQQYLVLGEMLNFSTKAIEEAYIGKNKVNHQRQNEGY